MKKMFITLAAVMLFSIAGAAEDLGAYFFVQVKSGNYKVIEKLFFAEFKDNFSYKMENQTFYIKTSLEQRTKFLENLKKLHHLESTANPDLFTVVVLESGIVLYTIDSTAVNTMPQRLLELQKLLDKNIRGNSADMIRRRETELPGIRVALEKSGFECEIKGKHITIRERKYPREFSFPEAIRKQVSAIFAQQQIPCEVSAGRISCRITNTQLQKLQHELLASGAVHKISIEKDGILKLLPVPTARFQVTISFNNRFEYEKCLKQLSGSSKFTIADQEFEEHAAGINLCTLHIRSRKATAAEIKDEIWRQVRRAGTRVRERDIKIEKK